MTKRIIQLCYRKIIDSNAQKAWDKYVFEDTFTEYLMQSQLYNQEKKYNTFSELINNIPAAEKLHFLVGVAANGYIKQLNEKVPDIVNNLGKLFLPFKNYRFEIINSDAKYKAAHQVAVNFYTTPLIWLDTVGNQLLVALNAGDNNDGVLLTEMFSLQPFLSIYSVKEMYEL